MATVEQCETQPSRLSSISNTLNLYDTFKSSQDDEKDSDEESFHLPMLDCDDDQEASTKEMIETGKEAQNGETEDDILNKFETNATPDIDPKMEDSILDEIDNFLGKKVDETGDTPGAIKGNHCDNKPKKMESNVETRSDADDMISKSPEIHQNGKESEMNEENRNADEIQKSGEKSESPLEDKGTKLDEKISDKDINIENSLGNIDKTLEDEKISDRKIVNQILNSAEDKQVTLEEEKILLHEEADTENSENGEVTLEDESILKNIETSSNEVTFSKNLDTENSLTNKKIVLEEINDKRDTTTKDVENRKSINFDKIGLIIKDTELADEITSYDNVKITDIAENITNDNQQQPDGETEVVNDQKMDDVVENVECPSVVNTSNANLINTRSKTDNDVEAMGIDNTEEKEVMEVDSKEEKKALEIENGEGKETVDIDNREEKETEEVDNKEEKEAMEIDRDDMETINENSNEPTSEPTSQENNDNENSAKKQNICDDPDPCETVPSPKDKESSSQITENNSHSHNENSAKKQNICDDPDPCETVPSPKDKESSSQIIENNSHSVIESKESDETVAVDAINTQDKAGPDKCENSNDSSKSQNLECDDLLDISIIRDADEDNASAIAEHANDGHASEKSDNDNDDQEDGSDRAENELDESEIDQDDTLLANDKDDNMDFEDGSSNLCDQDNVISENVSESDIKDDDTEMRDLENDSKESSSVLKEKNNLDDIELNSERNQSEEENFEQIDKTSDTVSDETQDSLKENSYKAGKRSLNETDIIDSPSKKIKLSDRSKREESISIKKDIIVKTLVSFEKYMQNKKLENKLTRSDLEQFCLQKICEAIMHKTDVGELHQTIKKQEQVIENLRKDLQQLTKQARDLDIVNRKLMTELKTQNGTKKPLVPLKITRSVGLQVKLNPSTETNNRRKMPGPPTPRTPTNNPTARPRTVTPSNASVVRQVAPSPRKNTTAAPLLSQALSRQTTPVSSVTKRTPIRPKPAEPPKPPNSSVIDLTDEDDKTAKGVVGNPLKIVSKTIPISQGKAINLVPAKSVPSKMLNSNQNKTVAVGQVKTTSVGGKVGTPTRTVTTLPQGVRLTPTQVKNGSIAIPASVVTSSSGTTQFMYVVQPGPVVTSTAGGTQKAVLLNFQPTNGVLTSTLNGSAVSVLPSKTSNTVQLKTVPAARKHPAPLPSPPPITVNASLKPLLPKPHLSIRKTDTGIILQWRMPYNLDIYEAIASYQLFAYQETNATPSTDMWRKVGDVKALALPMACTLTQFADKNKYYFAVRSVDVHKRIGAFSDPEEISL